MEEETNGDMAKSGRHGLEPYHGRVPGERALKLKRVQTIAGDRKYHLNFVEHSLAHAQGLSV